MSPLTCVRPISRVRDTPCPKPKRVCAGGTDMPIAKPGFWTVRGYGLHSYGLYSYGFCGYELPKQAHCSSEVPNYVRVITT